MVIHATKGKVVAPRTDSEEVKVPNTHCIRVFEACGVDSPCMAGLCQGPGSVQVKCQGYPLWLRVGTAMSQCGLCPKGACAGVMRPWRGGTSWQAPSSGGLMWFSQASVSFCMTELSWKITSPLQTFVLSWPVCPFCMHCFPLSFSAVLWQLGVPWQMAPSVFWMFNFQTVSQEQISFLYVLSSLGHFVIAMKSGLRLWPHLSDLLLSHL